MNCHFYKNWTNLTWFSTIIYVFQLCLLGPNSSWENITVYETRVAFVIEENWADRSGFWPQQRGRFWFAGGRLRRFRACPRARSLLQSLTRCSPVCCSCLWSFWAPESVWVSCSSGQWREGRSPGWWRGCPAQESPSGLWLPTGDADADWYCWNRPSPWVNAQEDRMGSKTRVKSASRYIW